MGFVGLGSPSLASVLLAGRWSQRRPVAGAWAASVFVGAGEHGFLVRAESDAANTGSDSPAGRVLEGSCPVLGS